MIRLLSFLLLALAFVVHSAANAQTRLTCPPRPEADTLEVQGVGVIQSLGSSTEGDATVFRDACLEYSGFLLRGEVFTVTEDVLEGENVSVESQGLIGTLGRIRAQDGEISVSRVTLELDPSFQIEGLASGNYKLFARSGRFRGLQLDLDNVRFDRITNGVIDLRLEAERTILAGGAATAVGVFFAIPEFSARGSLGLSVNGDLAGSNITGVIGRNAKSDELTFTAARAIQLDNGSTRLDGGVVRIFGIAIPVPDVEFNPYRIPTPYIAGDDAGVTVGFTGWQLGRGREVQLSAGVHQLFSSGPVLLSFTLQGARGTESFVLRQLYKDSLEARIQSEPASGPTFRFSLDTAWQLGNPAFQPGDGAFEEFRVGYRQQARFGDVVAVGKAEVGQVWQAAFFPNLTSPRTLEQNLGVAFGSGALAWGSSFGPFGLNARASGVLIGFTSGTNLPNPALHAGLGADLGVRFSDPWFQTGMGLSYSQTFLDTSPIRRYQTSSFTRAGFSARVTPQLPGVPLGYAGIALEAPVFGVNLEVDVRRWGDPVYQWRQLAFNIAFDLSYYNGQVLEDHFGQPWQTPVLTLSPFVRYDFAANPDVRGYQLGEFGASLTGYTQSLGLTLTFTWETRTALNGAFQAGPKFGFGARLR